jgi:hypothetical protein
MKVSPTVMPPVTLGMRTTKLELIATAAIARSSEVQPICAAGSCDTASAMTAAPAATTAHM